jgi:hypothetical protein
MRRRFIVFAVAGLCIAAASCAKSSNTNTDTDASSSVEVNLVDLHPCDVTHTSLTDEDCAAAGRWLAEAKTGTAAFSAPARMIQGQSRVVTLAMGTQAPPPPQPQPAESAAPSSEPEAVSGSDAAPAVSDQGPAEAAPKIKEHHAPLTTADAETSPTPHDVAAAAAPGAKVIDYYPLVGRMMQAKLEGEGFDITPMSAAEQLVADGAVTTWTWKVTAKEYGNKPLVMKTAVVMKDSRGQTQQLSPFSDTKVVYVIIGVQGVIDWLKDWTNLLKVLGGFIGALAAVVLAVKTFDKRKGKAKA